MRRSLPPATLFALAPHGNAAGGPAPAVSRRLAVAPPAVAYAGR